MSRVSVVSGSEGRFPKSLLEFQRRFATESACAEYLFERRWPEGFVCPGCGEGRAWLLKTKAFTYECADWGRQTSVTAGTIMHASKLPLTMWFWGGVSDVDALQRYLGAAAEQPSTTPAATRADKPFWPTALEEVLRTHAFRGKAALKLEQRLRKPSLRSRHDTHPCSSHTDESLPFSSCFVH